MSLLLPLFPAKAAYRYRLPIAGREYVLRFVWRERPASWYVDIGLTDGTWLARSQRVCTGWTLFSWVRDERMPPGTFYVYKRGASLEDPGLDDLGARVRIVYLDPAEAAEEVSDITIEVL